MKIDTHCHLFSPKFAETITEKTSYRFCVDRDKDTMTTFLGVKLPLSTEEERISEMDRIGIDTQIISVRTAALLSWEELSRSPETRVALSEAINDYLSHICQQYPKRFMAYADIPLSIRDVPAATREMIRCIDDLGLNGVSLLTHYEDKYLDSAEFYPFFEEANRRQLVIFIHPTHPLGTRNVITDYSMYGLVGFPYDTTLAASRLVYSGFTEKFKDLTLIFSHAGGTIPFLWWRIDMGYNLNFPGCHDKIASPPSEHLKRFYYDTALSDADSLMLTYERVGDHLMFGTDHPFTDTGIQRTIEAVKGMDISSETKAKIFGGNAANLLCRT